MRTNEIFKSKMIVLLTAVAILSVIGCDAVFAQRSPGFYPDGTSSKTTKSLFRASNGTSAIEMTMAYAVSWLTDVSYPGEAVDKDGNKVIHTLSYALPLDAQPFDVGAKIIVNNPVKVMYSLYMYKDSFDGATASLHTIQGIEECTSVTNFNMLTTQVDIDGKLNKVYQFPDVYEETQSGYRDLAWDGKTSSGQQVRGCMYFVANEAVADPNNPGKFKAGNLIAMFPTGSAVEKYRLASRPVLEYNAGPAGTKAVSAKIYLAYEMPVRRVWAILAKANCTVGSEYITYDVANLGGKDIAAGMNKKQPGSALAVTELKNPVLDKDGLVKIFTWDSITGLNGLPVVPLDGNTKYQMIIVIEGDDGKGNPIPTLTGLNDGYIYDRNENLLLFPVPGTMTDIENPAADNKTVIETTQDGFIIDPKDNFNGEWMLTSSAGLKLTAGKGSFVSKSGLPKGIYLLTVSNPQGVKETHKVVVR